MMNQQTVGIPLGIDINKKSCDVVLLKGNQRGKSRQFSNNASGFEQLSGWLKQQGVEQVHACLEATNVYGQALACYLHQQGQAVSLVNPSRIKGYAQSQLSRTKNDQADAGLIARFCRDLRPSCWQPAPAAVTKLQQYARRLGALERMLTQEKNRLVEHSDPELRVDIEAHIAFLAGQVEALKKRSQAQIQAHESLRELYELLVSITGISAVSATMILAEIGTVTPFDSARQLAAFAGLTPRERKSGSSLNGKTRLCKIGNARLRKALYFPALSLIQHCPPIQQFRERVLAAGKCKMQVVGAVMHKLIRVIYGVLKSGQPFDPEKLLPQAPRCAEC